MIFFLTIMLQRSSLMKKNGRKYRKLQKEKELQKADRKPMKVGEPFSRVSKKRRICLHYGMIGGGIIAGKGYSYLHPVSEDMCQCGCCGKKFPIEAMETMKHLIEYLECAGCCISAGMIRELSEGIEPVAYYRISEIECRICEMEDIAIPRHTCIVTD